jgi:hypothetical protein
MTVQHCLFPGLSGVCLAFRVNRFTIAVMRNNLVYELYRSGLIIVMIPVVRWV